MLPADTNNTKCRLQNWSPGLILNVTCTICRTGSVPEAPGACRGPRRAGNRLKNPESLFLLFPSQFSRWANFDAKEPPSFLKPPGQFCDDLSISSVCNPTALKVEKQKRKLKSPPCIQPKTRLLQESTNPDPPSGSHGVRGTRTNKKRPEIQLGKCR